jgi:hypothetical protein
MIAGAISAVLWQVIRSGLPAPLAGVHGFLVGVAVGLVVILLGTLLGRPAPSASVARAWGESGR